MTSSQKGKNWTIPSSKTEAGQQHLVQLKSHNSNTEKYTVLLHYSVVKTKVSQKKKHGRSSPVDHLSTFTPAPKRSPTVPTP
jgi:hypothetical protein